MGNRYSIQGTEEYSAEKRFQDLVQPLLSQPTLGEYTIDSLIRKKCRYRYFDTFDISLAPHNIEAFIGPLEEKKASLSLREREMRYMFTITFPLVGDSEEREEDELPIPTGSPFDEIDPNKFDFWDPLKKAKVYGMNRPLIEIVRLEVEAYRFNLQLEDDDKVQIALDGVNAMDPLGRQQFHELGIELIGYGEKADAAYVANHFTQKYPGVLHKDSTPKWIKAMKLLRGESLAKPSTDEEDTD